MNNLLCGPTIQEVAFACIFFAVFSSTPTEAALNFILICWAHYTKTAVKYSVLTPHFKSNIITLGAEIRCILCFITFPLHRQSWQMLLCYYLKVRETQLLLL